MLPPRAGTPERYTHTIYLTVVSSLGSLVGKSSDRAQLSIGTSIAAPPNESVRSLILGEWFPASNTGNGGDHSWWQSVQLTRGRSGRTPVDRPSASSAAPASGMPPIPFTVSGADREVGPSIFVQPRGHVPRESPSKKAVPYPTTLGNV